MIAFRPAVREEAEWIASRLRAEDAREVTTATGEHPSVVVPRAFDVSRHCFTIRYTNGVECDEHPLAIFGVADDPHTPSMGIVWLLATDDIRKAWLAIRQVAPRCLTELSLDYPGGLHNLVDARNAVHLRWLTLTGFRQRGSVQVRGHEFIHAVRATSGYPSV